MSAMDRTIKRINDLIARPSTPELRRNVLRMMANQMIDPSTESSVRMGLELALMIIEEEFGDESKQPRTKN